MSTIVNVFENTGEKFVVPLDQGRGILAMWMTIFTEGSLFVVLFCSYFFEGNNKNRWLTDQPPKFTLALILLGILASSSLILIMGERALKKREYLKARVAMGFTMLFGLAFLALESVDYLDHWKSLTPYSDAYGSLFYIITTFHASHVIVGLLLMGYVMFLPRFRPAHETPYKPYHAVSMYWHFVDIVWVFVVTILYLIPNGIVYVH